MGGQAVGSEMGRSSSRYVKALLETTRLVPWLLAGGAVLLAASPDAALAQAAVQQDAKPVGQDAQPAAASDSPQSAPASAQVDDVTVTARKREEKAQDVPLPISVVGGQTAQTQQLNRLPDFGQKVPNFVPAITNPRTSAMSIRGISGISGGADGSESAVGLIVDNVFYTHVGFQWSEFVDLQSLEVARGPQGTLLGKNTTVGAVVIRTQLPTFARSATLETTYGNYNHFIEKLNVTGPIIDDKLAGRVTLYLDKGDGWIQNQSTGQELLNNNRWGARGQLLFTGDNLTDRLIFDRLRSDEYNNYGPSPSLSIPFWANGAPARLFSQNLAKSSRDATADSGSLSALSCKTRQPRPAYDRRFERGELSDRGEHPDFRLCVA